MHSSKGPRPGGGYTDNPRGRRLDREVGRECRDSRASARVDFEVIYVAITDGLVAPFPAVAVSMNP